VTGNYQLWRLTYVDILLGWTKDVTPKMWVELQRTNTKAPINFSENISLIGIVPSDICRRLSWKHLDQNNEAPSALTVICLYIYIHTEIERERERGRNNSVSMSEWEVIGICDTVIKIIAVSFHTSQMRMAVFTLQTFLFVSFRTSHKMVTIDYSFSLTCSHFEL
jgi:hypothetical protein